MEYEFRSGELVTIEGDKFKVWEGCGLPSYEGSWQGLAQTLPKLAAKIAKALKMGKFKESKSLIPWF